MTKPNGILKADFAAGAVSARCVHGQIKIVPYRKNIIHVIYYAEDEVPLPMWGICGRPEQDLPLRFEEDGDSLTLKTGFLNIKADRASGRISFFDEQSHPWISLPEYSLEKNEDGETYRIKMEICANRGGHVYGLGQHQDGFLDLTGRSVPLWHDYSHKGGEVVAVPFLVSSSHFAVLMDNCSRGEVITESNGRICWKAEAGEALSAFLIFGEETDDLYEGYRALTGAVPLPPKAGLGFIQSKQRYATQKELLSVARTYRRKGYPCDILVVDWFHWKTLGDLRLNEKDWPDAEKMNRELRDMGFDVMISCWPRFMKESENYSFLEKNGWFMHGEDGKTVYGTPDDQRGALIDTTNPECGKWYWNTIRKNYGDKGFRYWWTDEDEPDISPYPFFLHAGSGKEIYNLYPLLHTRCLYEGHRKTYRHRCLILSRAAYTGAQRYGTTFWSSDIFPEWEVLERQVPTALNFCASGMPYWSSDIGGWQPLPDEETENSFRSLLVDTENVSEDQINKSSYTELYIRWFQFGAFCPTFRTHGTRKGNEVWSYGPQAEKILVRYLRLRYRLMPYIYSLAYQTSQTGAPFMRALWMDFEDPKVYGIGDEYMFGPAFLIAPVLKKGATFRKVYLPSGCKWYDFWTGRLYKGGQTVTAPAPIDTLPIFVKSGSIVPTGEVTPSAHTSQKKIGVRVYAGCNAHFTVFSDDGETYAYEQGEYELTELCWDEKTRRLSVSGGSLFPAAPQEDWLTVIG